MRCRNTICNVTSDAMSSHATAATSHRCCSSGSRRNPRLFDWIGNVRSKAARKSRQVIARTESCHVHTSIGLLPVRIVETFAASCGFLSTTGGGWDRNRTLLPDLDLAAYMTLYIRRAYLLWKSIQLR